MSPVRVQLEALFHVPSCSILGVASSVGLVNCTLYPTMRPLTSPHGVRPLHFTVITVELLAVALTLLGATPGSVEND